MHLHAVLTNKTLVKARDLKNICSYKESYKMDQGLVYNHVYYHGGVEDHSTSLVLLRMSTYPCPQLTSFLRDRDSYQQAKDMENTCGEGNNDMNQSSCKALVTPKL